MLFDIVYFYFINCMFNGLVIFALLINIYHLPIVNDYIKKYKKKCGFIILLIACIVFGFWYYFQIGRLVGFTIICISFYLIIWGILNTYKIKELFYMLLNLI